jgi:hypothetical protein
MKREGGSNFIDPFRGEPSSQLLPLRLSAFLFSDHSSELDVLQIKMPLHQRWNSICLAERVGLECMIFKGN